MYIYINKFNQSFSISRLPTLYLIASSGFNCSIYTRSLLMDKLALNLITVLY